ncbi:MAG: hypothetical protein IIB87_04705, partial [Chloroflexi bacterium]|nr:hypothetical protein [Chloroflexota bacterium]
FAYIGEQVDSSGLYYLRARYYGAASARLGHRAKGASSSILYRFLSQDPLPLLLR